MRNRLRNRDHKAGFARNPILLVLAFLLEPGGEQEHEHEQEAKRVAQGAHDFSFFTTVSDG